MKKVENSKGPWLYRFLIRSFTFIFGLLIFWTLGFFLKDIESIKGPDYKTIEAQYVDEDLYFNKLEVGKKIQVLVMEKNKVQNEMQIVKNSSQSLQKTINQLTSLKRLAIENSKTISNKEEEQLNKSIATFLEKQEKHEVLNGELLKIEVEKQKIEVEKQKIDKEINSQREEVTVQYNKVLRKHNLKLASLQILILLPFLLVGIYFILKKRQSNYFLLFASYSVAVFLKIFFVIHKYFPSRYFKYILVIILLITVVKLLTYLINIQKKPKQDWLMKQYKDGYENFMCPICDFPIRRGPRKYLHWTRSTVSRVKVISNGSEKEEKYTCPSCGTTLFEECGKCHNIRHSLLNSCNHCGDKKDNQKFDN